MRKTVKCEFCSNEVSTDDQTLGVCRDCMQARYVSDQVSERVEMLAYRSVEGDNNIVRVDYTFEAIDELIRVIRVQQALIDLLMKEVASLKEKK